MLNRWSFGQSATSKESLVSCRYDVFANICKKRGVHYAISHTIITIFCLFCKQLKKAKKPLKFVFVLEGENNCIILIHIGSEADIIWCEGPFKDLCNY